MIDDSGTHKLRLEDLKKTIAEPKDGFSKDEIDSIADLIGGDPRVDFNDDPDDDDTGRFRR